MPVFYRVLDIEPDSEDEDVILERRRQLRRAIEEKYQALNPAAASPAKSEASADSDLVGIQAAEYVVYCACVRACVCVVLFSQQGKGILYTHPCSRFKCPFGPYNTHTHAVLTG